MPCTSSEAQTSHTDNGLTIPKFSRQNSPKRSFSYTTEENDTEKASLKRVRSTTDNTLKCPLAYLGCDINVHGDNLQKHYSTEIHQKCLMRAIDLHIQQLHAQPKEDSTTAVDEETFSEIYESVDILTEGLSCLHEDNVRIHNDAVQVQSTISEQQKQVEQLKSSVEESVQMIHAIQMNTNILETEMEVMRQTMRDLLSQSSNDGTFIWKITDVRTKLNDAIAERQTSIYSPPFYSSPTGYKMCMRLYFNGDGHARRTHLSLFFVMLRGDYDAVLQWPFSHKITFYLFDQTTTQRHIIDSFRPDIRSNSFQRPQSNMNIASGIPKFCPLTIIQQDNNPYVRDDCMFIRCIVDFASTPKSMLPYVCSINPGLPAVVQRTLIQAEIDRRKSTAPGDSSVQKDPSK